MNIRVLAGLLVAASFAGTSSAQVAARLSGSVVDSTGWPVSNAMADVLLPDGAKPILTATTTAEGIFAFIAAPPHQRGRLFAEPALARSSRRVHYLNFK